MDVVKIILYDSKNRVLLQLRTKDAIDGGKWSLFGGSSEEGETPEHAIVREIKEEINYDLKNFKRFDKQGNRYWFLGKIDKDVSELKLGEGDDFGFFSAKEIRNMNLTDNTRKMLDKFFRAQNSCF